MTRKILLSTMLILCTSGAWGGETFNLPPLPPPEPVNTHHLTDNN